MRFSPRRDLGGQVFSSFTLVLIPMLIVAALGCGACKSSEDRKEINKIKKKLKTMLEKPVSMHQVRMEKTQQQFTDKLQAVLEKPSAAKRLALIKEIEAADENLWVKLMGEELKAVNLSRDGWTMNGEPAGILVTNTSDAPIEPVINVDCAAPPQVFPMTAIIDNGVKKQEMVFKEIGFRPIKFPAVKPQSKALYILSTDKTWVPGTHDKRKLGVRVTVPLNSYLSRLAQKPNPQVRAKLVAAIFRHETSDYATLVDPYTATVALTPAGWTTDQGPGALCVNNPGKQPYTPTFTLSCNAPESVLPITAVFDDGKRKIKHVFRKQGHKIVTLPPAAPGEQVLYLVTTDKTWDPGTDRKEKLGVRITNPLDSAIRSLLIHSNPAKRARVVEDLFTMKIELINLLGDMVLAVGLSGDRWTQDSEPAGIAVNNPGKEPLSLQLILSCGAPNTVLPLTAVIDDGRTKLKKVFTHQGSQVVSLPAVPAGSKRLFIISTDKSWTPGTHDKRLLGVNVNLSVVPMLQMLAKGEGAPQLWKLLGRAIAHGNLQGKLMLAGPHMVALGLSEDRWTGADSPGAVVVSNESNKAWTPKLQLTVAAGKESLPLTATLIDSGKSSKVTFTSADSKLVKLTPVPAGQVKLYLITTDRTYKQPPDTRALGVNIGIPAGLKPPDRSMTPPAPPPAPATAPPPAPATAPAAKTPPAKAPPAMAPAAKTAS